MSKSINMGYRSVNTYSMAEVKRYLEFMTDLKDDIINDRPVFVKLGRGAFAGSTVRLIVDKTDPEWRNLYYLFEDEPNKRGYGRLLNVNQGVIWKCKLDNSNRIFKLDWDKERSYALKHSNPEIIIRRNDINTIEVKADKLAPPVYGNSLVDLAGSTISPGEYLVMIAGKSRSGGSDYFLRLVKYVSRTEKRAEFINITMSEDQKAGIETGGQFAAGINNGRVHGIKINVEETLQCALALGDYNLSNLPLTFGLNMVS